MEIVHVYDDDDTKGGPATSKATAKEGLPRQDICNSFCGWNYSPHLQRELMILAAQGKASSPTEPRTYRQALKSPEADLWRKAMDEEYGSLMENGTWKLVPLPQGRKPIGGKWVYKLKRDEHGEISRYKARLVAQGYTQIPGVDFHETSAPVAAFTTLRALLKIAVERSYIVHQMDVKTAFLNGTLDEEIYMKQPLGYEGKDPSMVCQLVKSIYGLKQAQKVWNDLFNSALQAMQFEPSEGDPCLYHRDTQRGRQYILIYVDDVVLVFNDEGALRSTKTALQERFTMTDMGELNWFLGMKVSWAPDRSWIKLDQSQYIRQVLERFEMTNCHEKGSPLPSGPPLSKEDCPQTDEQKADMANVPYREAVGCLMYAMVGTRPDLAFTVGCLSRYVANPGRKHWKALRHTLRYLKGTADEGLILKQDSLLDLHAYVDADWATDPDTRKSVSGIIIMLGSTPIYWKSQKQGLVTCSTTEAEYVALCKCLQELKWIKRVVASMTEVRTPTTVYEDNMSCIHLATGEKVKSRSKHIDVKYHYVRDQVKEGEVKIEHMPTDRMLADLLTKGLSATKTLELKKGLFIRREGHRGQWEVGLPQPPNDEEKDWDLGLAMRFWTRITKTEPERPTVTDVVSLLSEEGPEEPGVPNRDRREGGRPSPLNTPLRTKFVGRTTSIPNCDGNSETTPTADELIEPQIELRLDSKTDSNSKEIMSQTNKTTLKRRLADGEVLWTPPHKRACLEEWARNRVIRDLTVPDYNAFTDAGLTDEEKLLRTDILAEVDAVHAVLQQTPHPPANARMPDQICSSGPRATQMRTYSDLVNADPITSAQRARLVRSDFVGSYLVRMESPDDIAHVLDVTGTIASRAMQDPTNPNVGTGFLSFIKAGQQGVSHGEEVDDEDEPDEGDDVEEVEEGDELSVSSMQQAMGDQPIVYCGRQKRQGRLLHMFGIVETDQVLVRENERLRQLLAQREATIQTMQQDIQALQPVKTALDARMIDPGDLLQWMGRVQEGDEAMRTGPPINAAQAKYFKELLKGLQRRAGAMDQAVLAMMQESVHASKAMTIKDRTFFVNGIANTLETMSEAIIHDRIDKKTWTKANFNFDIPMNLLVLAVTLCASEQMGVTGRAAKRLLVSLTGLVSCTKERGLFKGRNEPSGWGYDMVLVDTYLNLAKDTATG